MKCLKCGEELEQEDGINGSDFYPCYKCKMGYNVITSTIDEEGSVID